MTLRKKEERREEIKKGNSEDVKGAVTNHVTFYRKIWTRDTKQIDKMDKIPLNGKYLSVIKHPKKAFV